MELMYPVIERAPYFHKQWVLWAGLANFREAKEYDKGDGDNALYVCMVGVVTGTHKASCRIQAHGGELGQLDHWIGPDPRGRDFALWCALTFCYHKGVDSCFMGKLSQSTHPQATELLAREAKLPRNYPQRFLEAFEPRLDTI